MMKSQHGMTPLGPACAGSANAGETPALRKRPFASSATPLVSSKPRPADSAEGRSQRDNPRVASAVTPPIGPRGVALLIALAAIGLALIPAIWKPWVHGNDGVRNYAYCRSFWLDGDLNFSNEFNHYRDAGEYEIKDVSHYKGRPGNALGVGSSILWSPFFGAGHLWARLGHAPTDGYSAPYARAISIGSTLYALLGVLLMADLLRRRFGAGAALVATFAIWFATPLIFYMYLHPSMSHADSFFLCSLLVWQTDRWRDGAPPTWYVVMGLTAGLAVATRYNNAVLLLVLLPTWLRGSTATGGAGRAFFACVGRALANAALILIGLAIGVLPQLAAWKYMYGEWFAGPRDYTLEQNLKLASSPHFLDLLVSGWRGMFIWSPVIAVAVIGLAALALRRRRGVDVALLIAFLIQLWVIGGWHMWWGGASFGQRFFINFSPAFALGVAYLFQGLRTVTQRFVFVLAVVTCTVWSAGLAVQYIAEIIPREEPVAIRTLARNQVARVPDWMAGHLGLLAPDARTHPIDKEETR